VTTVPFLLLIAQLSSTMPRTYKHHTRPWLSQTSSQNEKL